MSHIRRISVHVDEPEPGQFYWVLMEEGDDASQWHEVETAGEGCSAWLQALQAGNTALLRLAPDPQVGPREDGDDEDTSPVGIPLR